MIKNKKIPAEMGMHFFGKMTASSTHEIKNTLAIINENAGLLEDLSRMAEKGHPLSFDRIQMICLRITKQVQRADVILKKLNQFSHSVDQSSQVVDLEQTVLFVMNLASRLIEMQQASIEISPAHTPIVIDTSLFYLKNIIWRAIEITLSADQGKKVTISFGSDSSAPSIWFSMKEVKDDVMDNLFGSKEDTVLLEHLGISVEINKKSNRFGLIWPK